MLSINYRTARVRTCKRFAYAPGGWKSVPVRRGNSLAAYPTPESTPSLAAGHQVREHQADGLAFEVKGQLQRANTERSHERTFKSAVLAQKVSISREMSVVYPVTQGVFIYTRGLMRVQGCLLF